MFTPMMKQYMQVKEKYSDCILFYRLGDFYEMFFDDAELAAREMELVLTSRECGLEKAAPMCGVPYHSAETYIEKLVENGHKVAICEQLTEPKPGRALVERDVVRIVTPGTLIETHMLDEKKSNYICAVFLREDSAGMAYCDVSTGEFVLSFLEGQNALRDEMARILPGEVLSNDMEALKQRVSRDYYFSENPPEYFDYATALSALMRHFPEDLWRDMSQRMRENLLPAAGALLSYLEHTQKNNLVHITGFEMRDNRRYMGLDGFTRRNLELTASLRQSGKKGTLLSLLDKTSTSMGGRQLRAWVEQPLQDIETIERRLDGVAALHDDLVLQSDLSEQLLKVYDIERLLSRISSGAVNGRDCLSLERTLRQVPRIQDNLRENGNAALTVISDFLDPLESLAALPL